MSETAGNFIWANYGGSQAFDNDDGSSNFFTHDNAFYMSDGFKMVRVGVARERGWSSRIRHAPTRPAQDYGGHDSVFARNVIAVREYDGQSCLNEGDYVPGHESAQFGNVCVLPPQGSRGDPHLVAAGLGSSCEGSPPGTPITHDNAYFTVDGVATVSCANGSRVDLRALPPPSEARSTVGVAPDGATLVAWFREKLELAA
jgi:hypothetical protein